MKSVHWTTFLKSNSSPIMVTACRKEALAREKEEQERRKKEEEQEEKFGGMPGGTFICDADLVNVIGIYISLTNLGFLIKAQQRSLN